MYIMLTHGTTLWAYLTDHERMLADDGAFLVDDSVHHPDQEPTDYSYLVFPFAKLFEGFLKDALFDLEVITLRDYKSTHFRIGKVLSPNLARRLGPRSAYAILRARYGASLPDTLWHAWKQGRNLTFHYFPSDFRILSREQALTTINLIIQAMQLTLEQTGVKRKA